MESYHGSISRNHLYEKDPWNARDVPGAPLGSQGFPGHTPGTPRDAPGNPMDAPETPGQAPGTPPGTLLGPPGTPIDHKNGQISPSIQRQKLAIALFEPAS